MVARSRNSSSEARPGARATPAAAPSRLGAQLAGARQRLDALQHLGRDRDVGSPERERMRIASSGMTA
jgi:hypothetical protein